MYHSFLPLHSDGVSLLLGNLIPLSKLWSQLHLLAWRMAYPIIIIQDRLMVHSNQLILYGTTQILALPQSFPSQIVLGLRKPWLVRPEMGKLPNLSQILHYKMLGHCEAQRCKKWVVGITSIIIPAIYLAGALSSWIPQTWESEPHLLASVWFVK